MLNLSSSLDPILRMISVLFAYAGPYYLQFVIPSSLLSSLTFLVQKHPPNPRYPKTHTSRQIQSVYLRVPHVLPCSRKGAGSPVFVFNGY